MPESPVRALLVYPQFSPRSFWNYQATCEVVGAKYSAAPLGLITVAALLPESWDVRLIDRNIETLRDSDLEWADMVMTGGMLPQQGDTLRVIALAHGKGKPVVVGGPDVTCNSEAYGDAEFRVLGEAEEIIGEFVRAWEKGASGGVFRAEKYPDVTRSPIPRFELLKLRHYMHVGVQRSRGCPFNCEFCNVIELNGRVPRVKTDDQMLRELDTLYELGYRGHVDFVDDNLIGSPPKLKPFLKNLAVWLEERKHPFEFTTEASINLAEDDELLELMRRANFFAIFVGIETPDISTLKQTNKRHNTRKNIAESMHRIYRAGIFVNAGFIIGFDGESGPVADGMVDCIEEAAIPVCMVGLLYALPNTQLSRRLQSEGRLHGGGASVVCDGEEVDQCTSGLNFTTTRPRRAMLEDYRLVLDTIYRPEAFFARVRRLGRDLDLRGRKLGRSPGSYLRDLRSLARISWRNGLMDPGVRWPFWRAIGDCILHNPRALRVVVSLAALYLHYRSFARYMDGHLSGMIAALPVATEATP
jgi:radical SAM superfamily enzyme YgiQ (UPF0313 family)